MSKPELPARYAEFHSAAGAMLYAALGAAWALVGVLEMRPVAMPWLAIVLGMVTGVLLILSFRALQRASGIDERELSPEEAAERDRRATRSRHVLRAQGLLITVVSVALFVTQNHAYVAPVTAMIVGLHFVALAPIHRTRIEATVGVLIVALAIATVVFVPGVTSVHRNPMNIAAGLGTAIILWGGATAILLQNGRAQIEDGVQL